jgi:hypothetical protein
MTLIRSRRTEECLSDLTLDSVLAGDASAAEEAAARAHAGACERCRDRWAELEDARRLFLASHPAFVPAVAAKGRSRRWPVRAGQAIALLAAAACLLLWMRRPKPEESAGTERLKGGSSFGFFVKHDESVVRGADDQVVRPGDRLRFVVHSPRRHVAILSVDGARNVNVYFPGEPRTEAVDAASELALPQSIRLDDVLGRETLFGIFCDGPTDLAPVRDRLRKDPEAMPVVPGCEVRTLTIRKDR